GWSCFTRVVLHAAVLSSASRRRSRPPSEGAVVAMHSGIRRVPIVSCAALPL
ncbi:unnamed protein product, partial [Ectocarpus sp. 13 AM-2016]